MFVDRQAELAFLNAVLERKRPTAPNSSCSTAAGAWARPSCCAIGPSRAACRTPIGLPKRNLPPCSGASSLPASWASSPSNAPAFDSWADCWQAIAAFLADRRHVLILDEFTYAVESDSGMLSSLQHAWDQQFKDSQIVLILCGSHVHTMETLQARQSPLFGRLTAQWWLRPLPYSALREFYPDWSAEERVAAYAVVGGVPAYLEWLDPGLSLSDNIRQVVLAPGSMFVAEPAFLLYDEVREPGTHLAILKAIGAGNHTLSEIANAALVGQTHLSAYLARLRELRLVERRLPVTVPPARRRRARSGRYHLSDPYFRFYFRFIAPHQDELSYQPERLLPRIREGLRAFVGATAFEELCRQWVAEQGRAGRLPFEVQEVGSHWSREVQVDVVGVNWAEQGDPAGRMQMGRGRRRAGRRARVDRDQDAQGAQSVAR